MDIKKLLSDHFSVFGEMTIRDGVVDVKGHVYFRDNDLEQMPVQFGTIDGDLVIEDSSIKTLRGAPHVVKGGVNIKDCHHLTSCVHGPSVVGGFVHIFRCPLRSLEGFPTRCTHAIVDYDHDLPLLRLLQATRSVEFYVSDFDETKEQAANILEPIMNNTRWLGKGKQGMLNCALEMKKAGFAGNARW
jgi:hypothetical protein